MTFLADYDSDVFISYARVDDIPFAGAPKGWITVLVQDLEILLRQKLPDRDGRLKVWMDHEMSGNQPITSGIGDASRGAATLLVVVSPGYLDSTWCADELRMFLEHSRQYGQARIFVLHLEPIARENLPEALRDVRGYRFWIEDGQRRIPRILGYPVPSSDDREYYSRLLELATDLAAELKRAKQPAPGDLDARGADTRVKVFLADTTDDLDVRREEVRRYLAQAGMRVLPETHYAQDERASFERTMLADVADCRVFVQLLSDAAGPRPPAVPEGFPAFQLAIAERAKVPIIQWRPKALDLDTVEDAGHRQLLAGVRVMACGMEELKGTVAVLVTKPAEVPRAKPFEVVVFVNYDGPDRTLANEIATALKGEGLGYVYRLHDGTAEEIRRDLEENLLACDGLLLVYGSSSPFWVRGQVREYRKIRNLREKQPGIVALVDGPPRDKPGLDLALPYIRWIECRSGGVANGVREAVQALKALP